MPAHNSNLGEDRGLSVSDRKWCSFRFEGFRLSLFLRFCCGGLCTKENEREQHKSRRVYSAF